ncbi:hypothetical protein [Mucilaginibacter flavus]|uniref:hypothetical protein n=1 Tax=Mucilaginibacter flavus TaxID=931504 RepID=UPI0025B36B69|nr:hypothetical protein [Mucilaginibacter flavus]MDN3584379.1 hypothetical protein [Mucilaginibacter flavus]
MEGKLEAHYQNRIYYFYIVDQKPAAITITMYTTPYTFVQVGERWVNHGSNRMEMATGLIAAVLVAANIV